VGFFALGAPVEVTMDMARLAPEEEGALVA